MAKYSFEFKKQIVEEYIRGEGGKDFLAKKYNVPAPSNIKKWVDNYKTFGDDGLIRTRKNKDFSFEKKLAVVELYLSSEVSYQELALSEGVRNPAQLCKWVNDFRIAGSDALRSKQKGRKKSLEPYKNTKNIKAIDIEPVDMSTEHIKQLEDENLKLRIENAYLKELRRLRLEDEARQREPQESSTASEENLN